MPPLFITDAEVEATLTPPLLLATIEDALAGLAAGTVINGGKVSIALDDDDGARSLLALIGAMPGKHVAGVKWVGTFNRNAERGLARAPATMLLTDSVTGALRAVVEATSLTARRTAAALVVAAKCFDGERRRAAILGFGAIGRSLVPLLGAAFRLESIAVWGGRREQLATNAARLQAAHGIPITTCETPQDAARDADLVFTASGLGEDKPFLARAMIADHTVVCCAGTYQEIADDLVHASDCLLVDDWTACQKRGNLAAMVKRGAVNRSSVRMEIPALVAQARASGPVAAHRPVVITIGIGALDVAIGAALIEARPVGRISEA
jgi:N-[(2S)-2-amino-2-carboxyethyl]-L-glutamate dehydrogenase